MKKAGIKGRTSHRDLLRAIRRNRELLRDNRELLREILDILEDNNNHSRKRKRR
ncbi:hypothetical protein [Ammoniphilus sp. 3BR4]|uniref:hypothetical protein n=1 Tax=Ammoniphilus sp. 3BR4 TaxID=3158265 RepID=UPI00346612B2